MTLLLAPGFMLDADVWADMEGGLQRFGPLVFADTARDDTIEAMARRAIATTPAPFALIGFSMGGYIAREIVRMAPQAVTALVLVATSARGDSEVQARRKAAAAARAGALGFRGMSRSALSMSLHPDRAADAALLDRMQAMGARLGQDAFLRQSRLDRHGDADQLGAIACPTLVVAGAQDRLRSLAEAEELHAGIPGSELTVIEDVGHMIPMEAPDMLLRVVGGWLDGVGRRAV